MRNLHIDSASNYVSSNGTKKNVDKCTRHTHIHYTQLTVGSSVGSSVVKVGDTVGLLVGFLVGFKVGDLVGDIWNNKNFPTITIIMRLYFKTIQNISPNHPSKLTVVGDAVIGAAVVGAAVVGAAVVGASVMGEGCIVLVVKKKRMQRCVCQ